MTRMFGVLIGAAAALLVARGTDAGTIVYVSVSGENRIDVYEADGGRLRRTSNAATDGAPGALAYCPKRQLLFAALRPEGRLVVFQVAPETGALTFISTHDVEIDPAHLCVDEAGNFLLAAYYPSGQISVHRIGEDGRLAEPGAFTPTAVNAHAVVLHPRDESRLYVPHTSANRIFQFAFDRDSGNVRPLNRPYRTTPDGTGPRHLVFHERLNVAYVSNEQGGSVSVWNYDPSSGDLSLRQTVSTLPGGFQGQNACSEIRLRPGSRHLYVANRGHDSLAAFSINPEDGRLTAIRQAVTEQTPRSFDIDPDGTRVYAAGEGSGHIKIYRIDDTTGELLPGDRVYVGMAPWWVMAIAAP
ncbi:MAG: lactonase family protein [Planctomyces sp.]|nr:lactonase family protein [Planctomyces sp.]